MIPQDDASELKLRDYVRVLRRRKWTVLLSTVVVVAAALVASFLQTPVYQGSTEILLQTNDPTQSLFNPTNGQRNDPQRALDTEIQVLESQPVKDAVRKQLGSAPAISASSVGQTDVIDVKAKSTVPKRAADVANAYATAYIDFRRTQAVDNLLAAGKEIQAKIDQIQGQVDSLNSQIDQVPAAQQAVVAQPLRSQRDSLIQQQALFKQKLDQLQVDSALKNGGAQVVTPASVPTSPVSPKPKRNGVLALAVGLMLGVGLAFLFEHLDDSIKAKEDIARVAGDLPVLGMIPSIANWKDRDLPLVVSQTHPNSPPSEAYRSLRTALQFMGLDRPTRLVQLTSPSAGEGKTTTLANLGVALARAGQRVIVVCCDLRRPRVHEFFGLDNAVGFTSVLLGDAPLSAALQDVPGEDRLRLLASGPPPPNPSELLSGRRAVEVLTALQAEADIVLLDTPPVLPVTDAAVLAPRMDVTLLVATAGSTTQRELGRALELLRQVEAPLAGVVLNGVTSDSGFGYGYGYGYGYGAATTDAAATAAPKAGEDVVRSNGRRSKHASAPRE